MKKELFNIYVIFFQLNKNCFIKCFAIIILFSDKKEKIHVMQLMPLQQFQHLQFHSRARCRLLLASHSHLVPLLPASRFHRS